MSLFVRIALAGLGALAGIAIGVSTGRKAAFAFPGPTCQSCTVQSNTFPNSLACVGDLSESVSCSISGNQCIASGTVYWNPATSSPHCLIGQTQGYDREYEAQGGPPQWHLHANWNELQSQASSVSTAHVGLYNCQSASYTLGVRMGVLHHPVTGTGPCTCNTQQTTPFAAQKDYLCQ
jgi:hypothetical protein